MKLAVNYSNALIRLIRENQLKVDLIKCPDWEGMLKEAAPFGKITIHYDLDAGLGITPSVDFSRILKLKECTATPHVNTHLVTPRNHDPENAQEIITINKLWRREISLMVNFFGEESVALEHFPYTHNMPNIRTAADENIFSQVIQDSNCMLLLDLAHARITANTLCKDVRNYIQALPLDRLVELHITGIKNYGGILTDHFGLSAEDWQLFEWAMINIKNRTWRKPEIVAFEYGGVGSVFAWRTNEQVLREQVPRLYNMVHD